MDCPKDNFIGRLQERCQSVHAQLPTYSDESTNTEFRFSCKLKELITNGVGPTKKMAKQNAAKAMLSKIEQENVSLGEGEVEEAPKNSNVSSVSKLLIYCVKEKKVEPQFADLAKDNGLFSISCTLDDYHAIGKGASKKEAKEDAASKVADHFGVHKFYETFVKAKESAVSKSAIQELAVLCKLKRLDPPIYEEEETKNNNVMSYKIRCAIGDLKEESSWSSSKKVAKHEVAMLMLQKLKSNTPQASPGETNTDLDASPTKKMKSD